MRICAIGQPHGLSRVVLIALAALVALGLSGCGSDETESAATSTSSPVGAASSETPQVIVLGNIDASNPSAKIEEFQPLADYLAVQLASSGIREGKVIIAQDTAEMARLLEEGSVNIYIDAPIAAIKVCEISGCEFVLRQWKGKQPELAGVFVTTRTSGISSIDDLDGKVIMLEDPHSTVGHILPLATLVQNGKSVHQVSEPLAPVAADEIGFYVSSGGQTSMHLLLDGQIDALAIGERAFNKFSTDVQEQVVIFGRTISVPSQLVAVQPGFDPELLSEITALLIGLESNEEGQVILEQLRETTRFDELPPGSDVQLDELHQMVELISQQ